MMADKKNFEEQLLEIFKSPRVRVGCVLVAIELMVSMNVQIWRTTRINTLYWPAIISVALMLINLKPQYRNRVIAAVTCFGWGYLDWFHLNSPLPYSLSLILISLALLLGFWWLAKSFFTSPLAYFIVALLIMLQSVHWLPIEGHLHQAITTLFLILSTFCWYFAYSLIDCKRLNWKEFLQDMGRYLPFWGGSLTPFAKGRRYQEMLAAKDCLQMSRSFLAGIHLLALALLWFVTNKALVSFYHYFQILTISELYTRLAQGTPLAATQAWMVLIRTFLDQTLWIAINGHMIIGLVRMTGIHAARNMDKPFFSQTIAEFWQRYYFYFKELLVTCFFYPCYFSLPKVKPWLKTAIATVMAAGLGNFIYHLLNSPQDALEKGLGWGIIQMQSYALYCLILAGAITLSQWRLMRAPKKNTKTWYAPVFVVGFYLLLTPLGQLFVKSNIALNGQFYLALLGVR